jgi:hypothetical protein
MSRRVLYAALGFFLIMSLTPGAAQAQLGGLVKKKAVEKATGKKDTDAAKPAKPKCDASRMVITSDVVGRYLKGLEARSAMEQKLAKEPGPTGAYYAAVLKRRLIEQRKAEFDLRRGPDWEKHQALQKRLMQGDTAAYSAQAALSQSLNPNSVSLPELDWQAQQQSRASMDSTTRVTGNFSDCDWIDLGERLPRLVWIIAQNENAKDFQGYGTAGEAAAIKPRIAELARAMDIKYESAEVRARKAELARQDSAKAAAPPTSGNPQIDCLARVQGEYMKAHQKEFDAASEKEDVATLMRLSQEALAEAMKKCPSD